MLFIHNTKGTLNQEMNEEEIILLIQQLFLLFVNTHGT